MTQITATVEKNGSKYRVVTRPSHGGYQARDAARQVVIETESYEEACMAFLLAVKEISGGNTVHLSKREGEWTTALAECSVGLKLALPEEVTA